MVPSNIVASYNIMVIDSLNYANDSVEISTPSIKIYPFIASNILNNDKVIVDLPAPVLPTTPIFSLDLIETVKFFNAGGKFSLY